MQQCMDLENEDDLKNNNHKKKEKASLQKKTWKPILGRKNLQLAAGHPRITDDYEKDLPEYEKNRLCTIEEEKKLFDKVKATALVLILKGAFTNYVYKLRLQDLSFFNHLRLHFLWYKSLQKVDFFDHLPPSPCKRSL